MAAVCQPDAAKPLNKVSRAAASSRCIGCGSNWAANRLMSSSVTLIEPLLNFMPSAKSSNHSIFPAFRMHITEAIRSTPVVPYHAKRKRTRRAACEHPSYAWLARPSRRVLLLPPPLHRPFKLRGGMIRGPDRFVFLALKLDEVGGGERVLSGLIELHAAIA